MCYRNGTVCVCHFVLWAWYCVHLSFCVMEMDRGGGEGGGGGYKWLKKNFSNMVACVFECVCVCVHVCVCVCVCTCACVCMCVCMYCHMCTLNTQRSLPVVLGFLKDEVLPSTLPHI